MAKANQRSRAAAAAASGKASAKRADAVTQRHRGRRYTPPPTRPTQPLALGDLWVAAGAGVVAAVVFASTFSSHVALGDAPETVTGVRSFGILHAPGYVVYVLAARVFGSVVAVGSWALRVNLFSLVCASLAVAVVTLVARGFGANRVGAAIGSVALATSVSFWFNADFAKYYAFSSLLLAVVILCVLLWQQRGSAYLLVIAGVLTGATLGVSWQLELIATVAIVVMLWRGSPRPRLGPALVAVGAALVTAAGVCVVILVRAHQDPTMNFGDASNLHRLLELLSAADFSGVRQSGGAGLGNFLKASPYYPAIVTRDAGLGAIALACVGIFDVYDRRRLDFGLFFAILGIGNIVGVGINWGYNTIFGFFPGLVMGGQLVGVYVVVAVLAALGASRLLYELDQWQTEARRTRARFAFAPGRAAAAAVAVMVIATAVPSLLVHHDLADHRMPPLADHYATRVFAALPKHSVLLTGGWEFGQPLIERQSLYGDRPDVAVVALDNLSLEWYRDQVVRRLGLDPSLVKATSATAGRVQIVDALRKTRPVYEDAYAMFSADTLFGYQPEGLVGRVVDGSGPQATPGVERFSAALVRGEREDGITSQKYNRFPNNTFYFLYERAHVELAKAYASADNLDRAADELVLGLRFGRKGENRSPVTLARKHDAQAKRIILNL